MGDGPASHIIIPCGHQCICAGCEVRVDACPVCRGPRHQCIRVFASGIQAEGQGETGIVENSVRKSKSKKEEVKVKKNKKERKDKNKRHWEDLMDKKAKKRKVEGSQVAPDSGVDDMPLADHLSENSTEKEEEDSDDIPLATTFRKAASREIVIETDPSSSPTALATQVDITCVAASSALKRDYESGCPTCKQYLREVKWSAPKKTFTVKCSGAKQHTLDYFNNKWMPERARQELLRAARVTSAGVESESASGLV